ncbi:hypothetical protein OIU77_015142 [Salix suchowensis]|uniref:Uncharacterized protein n=1 Tax=Salix suchowensis TaxID=1278906 RepID=A0ABQ8ZSJ8_9ROSI|nr:hypothetical protein OIU77_015142 [Salix suchowensis]
MEPTSNNSNCVLTKEEIPVQIESSEPFSQQPILCQCYRSLLLREPQNHLTEVILAEFLGEDQMLVVVCVSKETRECFCTIYFSGRFLVMCPEDIRCYNRSVA